MTIDFRVLWFVSARIHQQQRKREIKLTIDKCMVELVLAS